MKKDIIAVSPEQAVAYLINADFVPSSLPLVDLTAAFAEESEAAFENGHDDIFHENDEVGIRLRMDICSARNDVARFLLEALLHDIKRDCSLIASGGTTASADIQVNLEAVSYWAEQRFGIGIPFVLERYRRSLGEAGRTSDWMRVEIKIYAGYKISFSAGEGHHKKSSYMKIGLMGVKKNSPSERGMILLGLAQGKKFPPQGKPTAANKAAISYIRTAIRQLTGLSGDPFFAFNEGDGWKPRFKISFDAKNAEVRAKQRAKHISIENAEQHGELNSFAVDPGVEADAHDAEDDAAGQWLRAHDRNGGGNQ